MYRQRITLPHQSHLFPSNKQRRRKYIAIGSVIGVLFVIVAALALALALSEAKHPDDDLPPFHGVVLISIDGFRFDYWQRYVMDNSTLRR
jgi:hypothetical protein